MNKKRVGIYLFKDVEVLDFAGPFEVFSVAFASAGNIEEKLFNVSTVSENGEAVTARNGLRVVPDYSLSTAPAFDILVIPGGKGARETEMHKERLHHWIKEQQRSAEIITSVCTGALVLAKSGLLNGKCATTHWASYERLEEFKEVEVLRNVKFVDEDSIITSGGISAGINMAFHIINKLHGEQAVKLTAEWMEYDL
ncbi:DJ-1/PfpI family protein [Alteribacillus sp. HJP-4]|uniref:DJ-1/PfpI family protein n=1 Tax=Alteribacillus sp. HJP-4 TaxID=2775394 RepID=UPI0035CCD1AC